MRQNFVGTVLTEQARQGIYRYFPGADSQNATQNNPTVDRSGNPVRPATATGDLQSFSVFTDSAGRTRDTLRPGYDSTGFIQSVLLSRMPLPNDFTVGDGLNTAGIRFVRRLSGLDLNIGNGFDVNRDQLNLRVDHNFSSNHKLSVVPPMSMIGRRLWRRASQTGQGVQRRQPVATIHHRTPVSTLSPIRERTPRRLQETSDGAAPGMWAKANRDPRARSV
jgi:hypothetical protein